MCQERKFKFTIFKIKKCKTHHTIGSIRTQQLYLTVPYLYKYFPKIKKTKNGEREIWTL